MSVAGGEASGKSSQKFKPMNDRIKLTRDEKDEFINWLSSEFGRPVMWKAWLGTKVLAKARNLILKAARGGEMAQRAKCLDQPSIARDVVQRACAKSQGGHGDELFAHWMKLEHFNKGSKKILERREKVSKNAHRTNFRSKQKKHQCRHGN